MAASNLILDTIRINISCNQCFCFSAKEEKLNILTISLFPKWSTVVFGWYRVWVPLLVGVVGVEDWKMLAGKGDWRQGLYGPFGVCGRCMDKVLKGIFLLWNLINYNYFLRKSIYINTCHCYQGPQGFVFKRFCLTFKVVHVDESISYVILYLPVISVIWMLTVFLFVCVIVHDTLYLCLYLSSDHTISVNTHLLKSLAL